jgi:hypothetical protein
MRPMSSTSSDTASDTSNPCEAQLYQYAGSVFSDEPGKWETERNPLDGAFPGTLNNAPPNPSHFQTVDEDKRSFVEGERVTMMQIVNILGSLHRILLQLPVQVWVTS